MIITTAYQPATPRHPDAIRPAAAFPQTTTVLPPAITRQRGLGIIEVLVALVVVSFGVLGMAGLQLTGMKHSTAGYNRSKALMLAENMSTRMRINTPAVISQAYDGTDSDSLNCAVQPVPYCQATPGTTALPAACSTDELASFDAYSVACGDWGSARPDEGVKGLLPGGRLQVSCDDTTCKADSTYTVTVFWSETRTTSKVDATDRFRVQMRLKP